MERISGFHGKVTLRSHNPSGPRQYPRHRRPASPDAEREILRGSSPATPPQVASRFRPRPVPWTVPPVGRRDNRSRSAEGPARGRGRTPSMLARPFGRAVGLSFLGSHFLGSCFPGSYLPGSRLRSSPGSVSAPNRPSGFISVGAVGQPSLLSLFVRGARTVLRCLAEAAGRLDSSLRGHRSHGRNAATLVPGRIKPCPHRSGRIHPVAVIG